MAGLSKKSIVIIGMVGVVAALGFIFKEQLLVALNSASKVKAGYKAMDDTEGKDLTKFQKLDMCRNHYPWGAPTSTNADVVKRSLYICNGLFANQYDTKTKNPLWTSEILSKTNMKALVKKGLKIEGELIQDPDIPTTMQVYPTEFNNKYTMGFMAAPANMYAANIPKVDKAGLEVANKKLMQQSLLMTNVVPMAKGLRDGIWAALERDVRTQALNNRQEFLYVITGPVYLGGQVNGFLEKSKAAIPTHFFKIITNPGFYGSIAFIIPNKEVIFTANQPINDPNNLHYCGPENAQRVCSMNDFIVPIKEVERLTGLYFYPNLAPYYAAKTKQDVEEYIKKMGLDNK